MARILIVDDANEVRSFLTDLLNQNGHDVTATASLSEAQSELSTQNFDVILLDVGLPDGNGIDNMPNLINKLTPAPNVIVITGAADKNDAIKALRNGAWDYLQKPLSAKALLPMLERLLDYRATTQLLVEPSLKGREFVIGKSPAWLNALQQASIASKGDANIHITGETGTGKEVVSRLVHMNSFRTDFSFVTVDCASLSDTLGMSTLFGHKRGAFTGAQNAREGLIAQANGGTLFLDEIGELSLDLQKMLLRVLQERRYRPLGGKKERTSNFRLISATNRDLSKMVAAGSFRADLYYRLRGISITLPPLRQRGEDTRILAEHHCSTYCETMNLPPKHLSSDCIETLESYGWPGNVRELFHAVEAGIQRSGKSPIVLSQHLPTALRAERFNSQKKAGADLLFEDDAINTILLPNNDGELPSLKEARDSIKEKVERIYLMELMELTEGDIDEACAISKLSRSRLYKYLQEHNIRRSGWK
ncbi:sigma-54 dependent transcriptional regulator [Halodesulfovibrio sp.]|uniref:sigma-54-dependent transcriptional regulator n=1 Tax=Halodesulfovibrio sp. TaxID=1912772 RepID=UPI0025BAF326|nr:sigma-54 dependent transcriptional regulator [Halodesulfovibrio sp.]